jgi:hypothetical protein
VCKDEAPPDPEEMPIRERDPCDDPIDPWGAFIKCQKCLAHHLTWWAKNLGYYECTKCWHLHVTQEWLDRVEAEAHTLTFTSQDQMQVNKHRSAVHYSHPCTSKT